MQSQQQKRFILFVQSPLSAQDAVPVRILQDCGPSLQSYVSIVAVTRENIQSVPPQVRAGTPVLLDTVTGTFSKDASKVMQAMARRALSSVAPPTPKPTPLGLPPRIAQVPVPVPTPQPPTMTSEFGNVVRNAPQLDLGESFSSAQKDSATSLLESRSAIGGYGVAGSAFMGTGIGSRSASRLDGDAEWGAATIPMSEDMAQRYMNDAFGATSGGSIPPPSIGGGAGVSVAPPKQQYSERPSKVDGVDSAEVKALIESREQLDRRYKEKQTGTGASSFGMMQPQSKQERLMGAEGLQLLRPLTKPPGGDNPLSNVPF